MSGVGSRETGLDSLFASKPVGPGFEPCLGQSAKLAGAPKPLCLSATRTGYWPSLEGRSMSCVMLVQAASQVPQMTTHLLRPHCTPWNCRLKVSTLALNMSGNHKRPVVSRSKENTTRPVQVSRS